ncbi:MAG: APC family permease [Polyangiales bacterium]
MSEEAHSLKRVVGLPGAVLLGLGSILGTGVFVSIGLAAGVTGSSVLLATLIAGALAAFNGLSSAQLAAAHPVSGGTYEYGYRFLTPALGFSAGWLFLCAKSASAATAALGVVSYALGAASIDDAYTPALALCLVGLVSGLVASGLRRSNRVNALLVFLTMASLMTFVFAGVSANDAWPILEFRAGEAGLLEASALMFVAFAGYGRIATLGEEVSEPRKTIPRAIIATLVVSAALYVAVAIAYVGTPDVPSGASLEVVARSMGWSGLHLVVAAGALLAMLGVLLNLLLGLSRVTLAMARRGDLPAPLGSLSEDAQPRAAVFFVGALVALLAAIGDVRTTWSFSAFMVLVYYALTNLAALRLPPEHRLFPRWISGLGFLVCVGLAFWVTPVIWAVGLALLATGLVLRAIGHRLRARAT